MKIISVLSAWGMLLVVLGHSLPPINGLIYAPHWMGFLSRWIYSFHMPLFAFISGFCFYAFTRDSTYYGLLISKAKRLLLPYIFWISFMFLVKILLSAFVMNPISFSTELLVMHLLYPKQAAVSYYWFLTVLYFLFLLSPLIKQIKKSTNYVKEIFLTLIFLALNVVNPLQEYSILTINRVFDLLIYFWLGSLGAKYEQKINLSIGKHTMYTGILSLISLLLIYVESSNVWIKFVMACIGVCVSWGGGKCIRLLQFENFKYTKQQNIYHLFIAWNCPMFISNNHA